MAAEFNGCSGKKHFFDRKKFDELNLFPKYNELIEV